MSDSPVSFLALTPPSSSGAIGPVPGLFEVMAVLQARRGRRRLRFLGRALGAGLCISVVVACGVVAGGEGPERLLPDCARWEHRARGALMTARGVQLARMAVGGAPTTSLSALGLNSGDSVRFAVTDVGGVGTGGRFHLWAFFEGDAGQRGALVTNEGHAFTTTVVDVCGGR